LAHSVKGTINDSGRSSPSKLNTSQSQMFRIPKMSMSLKEQADAVELLLQRRTQDFANLKVHAQSVKGSILESGRSSPSKLNTSNSQLLRMPKTFTRDPGNTVELVIKRRTDSKDFAKLKIEA